VEGRSPGSGKLQNEAKAGIDVSLEPERVERLRKKLYEKAKREPDFRFYTLYDKVCWTETLARAYRQAKANAGAAGVDGVEFEDIEAYGVDRWLAELRQELVEEIYRPQPVRRVMIPKPGGGERPLGIPTVRDRVAQTAVVLILGPIFEADFEDNVYAYRPERSAQDALAEVQERLHGGQQHVVDADVTKYFDTIPHAELLQSVARRVADGKILHLLKLWLKSPVEEKEEGGNRRMTGGKKSKQGTPQGGVVSPLLANIYINRLLRHWKKTGASERLGQIVSYADDFVILCASWRQAEEGLALVSRWLEKLGLTIHPTKTRLCHAREEPFDFLGYTFGPARHGRTGKRLVTAWPSKKSQKRLKGKINALLSRGNPTPWPKLRDQLNRLLTGWAAYFSFGFTWDAYTAVGWHMRARVRRFLCRRHKLRVRRSRRFGYSEIHGKLGVINIHQKRPAGSLVHVFS
jgi:RNA-directed DNA polymerase